jgi:hypothetical protein
MEPPSNIRTKAYVVESKGSPFTLRDVVLDEVQPNEVLVEIWYTGICHTVRGLVFSRFTTGAFRPIDTRVGRRCPAWRHAHRKLSGSPRPRRSGSRALDRLRSQG